MLDMETIVIPLDHKPFGQYSIKKLFQNYERLSHRLRFFEPAKFAYTHCKCAWDYNKQFRILPYEVLHVHKTFN